MVILKQCSWCGGPHETVANCPHATSHWRNQFLRAVEAANRMNDKGEIPTLPNKEQG